MGEAKLWLLFLLSKLVEVVRMFASPLFVHLPKTLVCPLHPKNMDHTRDAPNQPPNRTMSSSNYLQALLMALLLVYFVPSTKLRAKSRCLLSRCILKCIRYLRNFSPTNISRILNPMGRYRCCVTSYLRSHAHGSNLDTRKAMCYQTSHK